jgi:hypothetical protein
MQDFFELFISFISDIFGLLNRFSIQSFGYSASLGSILIAFLVIGFVISVFWKGART